jgi:flagellar motor component MotA
MARSTVNYTVKDEGRDSGKVFVLTEMPASKAESWAMRALLALMASGVEVPEGFDRMGMAAMAEIGIRALSGLKWETAEPLLAEMWDCVQIMPDPTKPHVVRRLIEEDIEEIATRVKLRAEVWKLHTGFLKAVAPSISGGSPAAASKRGSRNI